MWRGTNVEFIRFMLEQLVVNTVERLAFREQHKAGRGVNIEQRPLCLSLILVLVHQGAPIKTLQIHQRSETLQDVL